MAPLIWLYTHESEGAVRIVESETESGSLELLVLGPKHHRDVHVFATADEAAAFRTSVETDLVARGFAFLMGPPQAAPGTAEKRHADAPVPRTCSHCGSTKVDEARRINDVVLLRCLHCWKLTTYITGTSTAPEGT
jgi:hypothetical protein